MNKFVIAIIFALFCLASCATTFKAADCPKTLEVKCVDDIRAGFDICEEAAKEKGSDTQIDIQCIKYFHGMQVDCWPCICYIANQDHVTIKGC